MDFTTVLETRKSIRSYTGECIPEDAMKKLIHAANASPVGMGKYNSIHLTIVKDKTILSELEDNTARVFNVKGGSFLYGAPELIIISTGTPDNVGYSNAAIIAQDMSLAAVDEGVGVCHIWGCIMALQSNPSLIQKLGIPEGFTPACALAIGVTTETYETREIPENRININEI